MNFKQVIFTGSIICCVSLISMVSVMVAIYTQLQTEIHQLQHKTTLFENELNSTVDNNNIKMAELKIELTSLNETLVDTQEELKKFASCKNLKDIGFNANGVYTITGGGTPFRAFCDMDKGGFMVFQRRFDGSTDFHQLFEAYATGFGNLNAEFWLGLEKMHQFTKNGRHQLRVDLLAYDNDTGYALYDNFSIGAAPGYQLHIGNYNGTAGDSLTYHNNQNFSTPAHDVDSLPNGNCAATYQGALWYNGCLSVNINAFDYHGKGNMGMRWWHFKDGNPMKATSMMVL